MNRTKSIKIKAALLALIFGLNPVIGFACSIKIDMGFNSGHHGHDEKEAVVHIHKDGKKHIHYEKKQGHNKPHSHGGDKKDHSQKEKQKDNCCTDQVKKFEELDKSLPQSLTIIHPDFFIAFFDVYYNADLPPNDIVRNIKQFVRSYHPPIPDIRIAIQSFQI
jgi:hypothetical protein